MHSFVAAIGHDVLSKFRLLAALTLIILLFHLTAKFLLHWHLKTKRNSVSLRHFLSTTELWESGLGEPPHVDLVHQLGNEARVSAERRKLIGAGAVPKLLALMRTKLPSDIGRCALRALLIVASHADSVDEVTQIVTVHAFVDAVSLLRGPQARWISADVIAFADCLCFRFERLGNAIDLDHAISLLSHVQETISNPDICVALVVALLLRSATFSRPEDCEHALTLLTPVLVPPTQSALQLFGNALKSALDGDDDLAIERLQASASAIGSLEPNPHQTQIMSRILVHLATLHAGRFRSSHDEADLQQALKAFQEVEHLTDKRASSSNVEHADLLLSQFRITSERQSLEDAMIRARAAVEASSQTHFARGRILAIASAVFMVHFDMSRNLSSIAYAISCLQEAVQIPDATAAVFSKLGTAHQMRYEAAGATSDLEDALRYQQGATSLDPQSASLRSKLGSALRAVAERGQRLKPLNTAIDEHRVAIHLAQAGDANLGRYHSNLGNALRARWEIARSEQDLQEAVAAQEEAVRLQPATAMYQNNLALTLLSASELRRQGDHLLRGMEAQRKAVSLVQETHPAFPDYLLTLGSCLRGQYEVSHEEALLDEAIAIQRQARSLVSPVDPRLPKCLTNLGNSLRLLFEKQGLRQILTECIDLHQEAVKLTLNNPSGQRATYLYNLANALALSDSRFDDISALRTAITHMGDALRCIATTHSQYPVYASVLGSFNLKLYLRSRSDTLSLESAIHWNTVALARTPPNLPNSGACRYNLAASLEEKWRRTGNTASLLESVRLLRETSGLALLDQSVQNAVSAALSRLEPQVPTL